MVADDSSRARKLKQGLENNGCYVYQISSGFDDLGIVCQEYFDLVVLDLEQAAANGFEICKKFKTEPELVGIPLVLLAPHIQADEAIRGLKIAAPVYCLAKDTFSEAMLLQIIEQTHYLTYRYL